MIDMNDIQHQITQIQEKIRKAAEKRNRDPKDIQIIAVTKTVDIEDIKKAIELGISHIGENRVQELVRKYEFIGNRAHWHMIGHLQRNKVKYIIDKVDLIHSLDSHELALEINKRAKAINKIMNCLLQVNISGEESKYGIKPEEAKEMLTKISILENVRIVGLMTMAPFVENQEEARIYFKGLKQLADEITRMDIKHVEIKYLSMGMSNDYEVAVEEGANLVRIGSAIFRNRKP